MPRHADVLDERDALKKPLFGSFLLHAGAFAVVAALGYADSSHKPAWGDPNSMGGGAFSVTAVNKLPLQARTGRLNRVANQTPSEVPEPVEKKVEPKRAVKEEPDAIALKAKKKPKPERDERYASTRRDQREYAENQLYTAGGQAATSPLYGMAPGSGGVGVGQGTPFGSQCGAYAQLLRDRVAQQWRTEQVDARIHRLPPAIVLFDLSRTGQAGNIRMSQSSGNYALDVSAQRAITQASPFEPIPPSCQGNPASIEFWFELKR